MKGCERVGIKDPIGAESTRLESDWCYSGFNFSHCVMQYLLKYSVHRRRIACYQAERKWHQRIYFRHEKLGNNLLPTNQFSILFRWEFQATHDQRTNPQQGNRLLHFLAIVIACLGLLDWHRLLPSNGQKKSGSGKCWVLQSPASFHYSQRFVAGADCSVACFSDSMVVGK